ncbi:unnamed protein product, partial [Onchocerca flexuosa]|uniref:BLVR domain-containing protein n=1 Tax=Onchocerca flexuosa TaxID=387005 RepID=A0A183HTU6_9BILA
MSTKSTRGHGDSDRSDDRDKMDVEGALALDLAELEAMLAIDSEQVRYDEQAKERDFQTEECSTTCSVDACNSQSIETSSRKKKQSISDEMKKLRRRRDAKSRVSKKTESLPLFLVDDDKLENVDSVNGDNKTPKETADNIRLPNST